MTGRKVLVADDEFLVGCVACDILEAVDAHVVLAADGLEALERLDSGQSFDLLLTDIRMPGMDGWTLAEKARERHPDIGVVYVTGYSDIDPRQVDGSSFLRKPYRDVDLLGAVTSLLANRVS